MWRPSRAIDSVLLRFRRGDATGKTAWALVAEADYNCCNCRELRQGSHVGQRTICRTETDFNALWFERAASTFGQMDVLRGRVKIMLFR